MGSEGEPRVAEGNRINESPDDESSPLVSEESLLPQQPSRVSDPKWYTVPNPSTPKRDAEAPPPTHPDWKASQVDASSYSCGDMEFPRRYLMTPAASCSTTVAAEQLQQAGDEPVRGWPAPSAPYPQGDPVEVIRDPAVGMWRPTGDPVTGAAMDPLTDVRKAATAAPADPGKFRAVDENAR